MHGSRWLCTHSHPSPQSIATRRSPLLLGRHPLHGGGARGRADARRGRARAVGGRHWRSRRLPRTCARHNFGPPITRRLQAHGQIQIQIQSGRSVGRSRSRAAAKGAAPGWRAAATGQPGRGAGLRAAPLSAGRPDRCPGGVLHASWDEHLAEVTSFVREHNGCYPCRRDGGAEQSLARWLEARRLEHALTLGKTHNTVLIANRPAVCSRRMGWVSCVCGPGIPRPSARRSRVAAAAP